MLLQAEDSQLLLIDYQQRLLPAMHEGERTVQRALQLAQAARQLAVPIGVTEQNPARLGPTVEALLPWVPAPVSKMTFSAAEAVGPLLQRPAQPPAGNARSLPRHLQKPQPVQAARASVVLSGWEAHVCVLQTALQLLEDEWDVWVVSDACASRFAPDRDAAFDRLAGAGVELVTTEMVIFEWLGGADHPKFKDILALVK